MAEHSAQTEQMQSVVDDLQQITTELDDALGEADDAVARLHGAWSGAAASAHQTAHDRWVADATAMNRALAQLRTVLTTARANYDSAADTNQRMWS